MVITDIVMQRKNTKRYSVFIDGIFAFGMSDVDILFYKLKIGDEILPERYEYILNEVIYTKAMEKATRFLSYRVRSEKEIREKLKQDFSDEITRRVIEVLKNYEYIDDRVFARAFISDSINLKKDGKFKIKYNLFQKGVDEEIIEEIFAEFEDKGENNVINLIDKKTGGKRDLDMKAKKKLYYFLSNKGYTYDEISPAFSKYFADDSLYD